MVNRGNGVFDENVTRWQFFGTNEVESGLPGIVILPEHQNLAFNLNL